MADYQFEKVLVHDILPGGGVRVVRGGSVDVIDWMTGDVVGQATADASGHAVVSTTDVGIIQLRSASGFLSEPIVAPELLIAAAVFGVSEDDAVAALLNSPGSSTRDALAGAVSGKADLTLVNTKANKPGLDVNVWDYSPVGNGVADDTAAVQAAIDAAGVGGKVRFGKGTFGQAKFKVGPLTMRNFQTWDGTTNQVGTGTGGAIVELVFNGLTGAQVGVTMATSCTLKNLLLRGPGSAVGTVAAISSAFPTARLKAVSVDSFVYGARLSAVYYGRISECEFVRCGIGVQATNCYNLLIDGETRFNCLKSDGTTYGFPISMVGACMVKMVGGSIENYLVGVGLDSACIFTGYSVYFESAGPNSVAVRCPSKAGSTVNLYGSEVYLPNHFAFVEMNGSTSSSLTSIGNFFKCSASTTPAVPTVYRYDANPDLDVFIRGDNWAAVTLAGTLYRLNAGTYPRVQVIPPQGAQATRPPQTWHSGTAAPTTGAWERGDYVRNSAPAVGSPKGWVCTVAGSPGTWVSEGNL